MQYSFHSTTEFRLVCSHKVVAGEKMVLWFIFYFNIITIFHICYIQCNIKWEEGHSGTEGKRLDVPNAVISNSDLIRQCKPWTCTFFRNLYKYEFNDKYVSYTTINARLYRYFREMCKTRPLCDMNHSTKYNDLGDTITYNDIVASQYKLLPYPLFTEKQLLAEHKFYQNNANNKEVFEVFPTGTLETINHHFFQGTQNFR